MIKLGYSWFQLKYAAAAVRPNVTDLKKWWCSNANGVFFVKMILALGILARSAGRRVVGGLVHLLLLVEGPTFLEECPYVHDQISERRRERDSFLGKQSPV